MNAASFNNNPKNDAPSSQAANTMQGGPTSAAPAQVAPPQQDANSMSHLEFLDGTRVSNQLGYFFGIKLT